MAYNTPKAEAAVHEPADDDSNSEAVAAAAASNLSEYAKRKSRQDRNRRMIRGTIGIVTVLIVWQLMAYFYDLHLILPPPLTVMNTVYHTLTLTYEQRWLYGPNIYEHLLASFTRAITGFTLAAIVAIPVGIIVGRVQVVREFFDPIVRTLFPIPGIAWIPMAILWFGLGNTAVIFVVFMAEFFPLYFNAQAGARNINPVIVDAARCYGAKGFTLFRRVILPASTPYIITGMRIALGGAWRMIVAGEMLASQSGIGSVLTEARYQFRAADLLMAMILISIIGFLTERLIVGTIEKKTTQKWDFRTA